jgi:hypothetical protein
MSNDNILKIEEGDTQRTTLVDLAADNAASVWYALKYPEKYRKVRTINGGHQVVVTIEDAEGVEDE